MDYLTYGKAQAVALALEQATGQTPHVQENEDHYRIYWTENQYPEIREKIEKLISKTEPGEIRVEWMPVITPIALKKAAPYLLLLVGAGFLLGKLT